MNREHPRNGANAPLRERSRVIFSSRPIRHRAGGFTLLEMIMVLVVIAILAAVSMPALESAMTEQKIRTDSHQLALMVKTAMMQSADQHRAYEIDLSSTTMALHPVGDAAAAADDDATDDSSASGDTSSDTSKPIDIVVTSTIDPANKLMGPDPQKPNAWTTIPDTTWIFEPGELCPATRVRFERGPAWLEISFDALTGNVDVDAVTEYMP